MHRRRDDRGRRHRAQQEPTVIQARRLPIQPRPTQRQKADAHQRDHLERNPPLPPHRRPKHRQPRRQRRTQQDRGRTRIGPEIHPCDVVHVIQHEHQHRRGRRQPQRRNQHRHRLPPPEPRQQPNEHQRPHHIELLFDRQTPRVVQRRRRTEQREIVLMREHLTPIRDIPQRRQRITTNQIELTRRRERHAIHRDTHHQHRQRRQQPPPRRAQNPPRPTPPVRADSARSNDVIKNPDNVKKKSTPRYPPRRCPP